VDILEIGVERQLFCLPKLGWFLEPCDMPMAYNNLGENNKIEKRNVLEF
jgi:hypothetical protein